MPSIEPSIYRLRIADLLTICVMGLLGLGILMVQSASITVVGDVRFRWTELGVKQMIFAVIGLVTYLAIGRFDYARLAQSAKEWRRPAYILLAIAGIACVLVLIPHIGISKNGARRWLPLGVAQVQPSELGKWAVVVFLAWWLSTHAERMSSFTGGFMLALAPAVVISLLIVIQDFGTAALIMTCTFVMLLAGRTRMTHIAAVVPPALGVAYWFVRHKEYRWRRMTAFLDPFANPRGEGYHMVQSLMSFATGGLMGRGLGNGIQKLGYLPEDTTDFIFSVICEELGLFGALLTIALYVGILIVAVQIIRQKRDAFGRFLAFGIAAMVGLQALINIAVATVAVPTKGLSLPLISAGGSGLVITCAALGLLKSIATHRHAQVAVASAAKTAPAREGDWELPSQALAACM